MALVRFHLIYRKIPAFLVGEGLEKCVGGVQCFFFNFSEAMHEGSRMCIINKDVCEHTCQSPGWTQGKQPTAVMACLDLTSLFLMLSVLLAVTEASFAQFTYQGASAPGDIIIGGLFPIHEAVTTVNYTAANGFSPPQRPICSKWVFIVENLVMKVRQKGDCTELIYLLTYFVIV